MMVVLRLFLLFIVIINEMEITVYLNHEAYSSRKSVYVARMVVSDSVEIDFTTLLRAMRLIYGTGCIVIFTCL